jgi:hypothetical protein
MVVVGMKLPASASQLKARLELRRSGASGAHKNKRKYSRKMKHKGKDE